MQHSDEFTLYDLRVEVVQGPEGRAMVCGHQVGDFFELRGENLSLPPGQTFPVYALAALLPLLREARLNVWSHLVLDLETANEVVALAGILGDLDYYQLLHLEPDARTSDIKRAFHACEP